MQNIPAILMYNKKFYMSLYLYYLGQSGSCQLLFDAFYSRKIGSCRRYIQRKAFVQSGRLLPRHRCQHRLLSYSQAKQTEIITWIVGSSSLAAQYVVAGSQIFLSRGHMAPDGDFIEAGSQDATYYFMNTAPQRQNFNGANWKYYYIIIMIIY